MKSFPAPDKMAAAMRALQDEFECALRRMCRESKEKIDYNPSRLWKMINDYGAVNAARKAIRSPNAIRGLEKPLKCGREDLTVEKLVLEERFALLFCDQLREKAKENLERARKRFVRG